MASELKVDTIKHTNNTGAITLDTSGNVTLAGSANNLGTVSAGTQITYKLGIEVANNNDNIYTNRTVSDSTDNNNRERGVSSLVAIELAP